MVFKTLNLDWIILCVGVDRQEKTKAVSVLKGTGKKSAKEIEKGSLVIKGKI